MPLPPSNKTAGHYCPLCENDDPPIVEDYATGDAICSDCGAVLEDHIVDMTSEWRTFTSDAGSVDPSRVGAAANPLLEDSGLSTMIARDPKGKNPLGDDLRKWNNRGAQSSSDRNLINAFRDIDRMAEHMSLPPKIANTSKEYYSKVEKHKSLRGRSTEAIVAACVYIGCRMEGVPRTLKEIAALASVPKKEISSAFSYIKKLLKLNEKMDHIKPDDFLTRFCSHLDLPETVRLAAGFIAEKATAMRLVAGKSPISVAAAAIFFICQICPPEHFKERSAISKIAGVSEVTIRNSYKDMYPARAELMPPKDKYPKAVAEGKTADSLPSV